MSPKTLKTALLAVVLLSGTVIAQEITDVSAERGAQGDVITIKLTKPRHPWTFFLKEPDRLVIDVKGAVYDQGKNQLDLNSPNISSVRWAQNSSDPPNFRVVADLKRDVIRKVSASSDGKEIHITIYGPNEQKTSETVSERQNTVPVLDEQKKLAGNIVIEARSIQSMEETVCPVATSDAVISAAPPEETPEISSSRFTKEIVPVGPSKIEDFSSAGKFRVLVSGKKLDLGRDPVWSQGRLMVPAKEFFSLAGYTSLYDRASRTAVFRMADEIEARIKDGSDIMTVNGKDRQLAVPVASVRGVLYVPFVSASNMIGLKVVWDKKDRVFFAAGRLTKVSWEDILGLKSVVIETSLPVATFETSFDDKLNVYIISLPGIVPDIDGAKIPVKEDGISGIKIIQEKGSARIGIYMESPLAAKPFFYDDKLVVGFPSMIRKVSVTGEANSVKIDIYSTKPVDFDLKRFRDPERIIVDVPNSLYGAQGYQEINSGGVLRVRASQFKAEPPASRIVVDTERELYFKAVVSEDKKHMTLTIEKEKKEIPKPAKVKILKGKVIVIDPGHGGNDPGAFGCSGERIREKDLNLATALKLAKLLSDAGAIPLLTRDSDVFVSLQDRVEFAKKNDPDIFISVHYNLSEKQNISGTETYYYNKNSKFLADVIHNNLTFNLKRKDGGVRKVKFYVVYNNTVPSVLIEPLYLSDRQEEALATNDEWQLYIARILFEGIKQYFEVLAKK